MPTLRTLRQRAVQRGIGLLNIFCEFNHRLNLRDCRRPCPNGVSFLHLIGRGASELSELGAHMNDSTPQPTSTMPRARPNHWPSGTVFSTSTKIASPMIQ